jgi:phage gp46-like protein
MDDFEGDLLLQDTLDGGDIVIADGTFAADRAFDTAIYLSLFGGNKDDDGRVKNNRTWWGNTLPGLSESEKLVSRFQAILAGTPMSAKTIHEAEAAARLDLQWLLTEGLADSVAVDCRTGMGSRFALRVNIAARSKNLYAGTFQIVWRQGGTHGV